MILVGIGIGLAVIAIRALVGQNPPQLQLLALALVGLLLYLIQFRLARRRMREDTPLQHDQPSPRRSAARRRSTRNNPFDYELTRNWTGLDERPTGGDPLRASDAKAQLVDSSNESTDPPR